MFILTFTDPQGVTHTDALFKINKANSVETQRDKINLDTTSWNTYITSSENSSNITYQVYFWANQVAFDSGKMPYLLSTTISGAYNFMPDSSYDGLTLEEKCEKHCQDIVIPNI